MPLLLALVQTSTWHLHLQEERHLHEPQQQVWDSTTDLVKVLNREAESPQIGDDLRLVSVDVLGAVPSHQSDTRKFCVTGLTSKRIA